MELCTIRKMSSAELPPGFKDPKAAKKRKRVRPGPKQWAEKDRTWFLSLSPKKKHKVCRDIWRAKIACLPWRSEGEMRLFWTGVIEKLAPDLTGDETEEELRDKRDGYNALRHLIWDLRLDREHLLAHAVVKRVGIDYENVKTIPLKWLTQADDWAKGKIDETQREARDLKDEADMAWRQEAVRKVIRKRRQGISVTFAQIAAEMNEDPGRGRRPRLSAEGLRRAYKKYSEEILEESEFDSSDDEDDDSD